MAGRWKPTEREYKSYQALFPGTQATCIACNAVFSPPYVTEVLCEACGRNARCKTCENRAAWVPVANNTNLWCGKCHAFTVLPTANG